MFKSIFKDIKATVGKGDETIALAAAIVHLAETVADVGEGICSRMKGHNDILDAFRQNLCLGSSAGAGSLECLSMNVRDGLSKLSAAIQEISIEAIVASIDDISSELNIIQSRTAVQPKKVVSGAAEFLPGGHQ